jgi:hypothetical protein
VTTSPDAPLNPRYLAYCRWHGKTPDEMHEHDRKEWPGGIMCGFILWSKARIQEAYKELPEAFRFGGLSDHDRYDNWLASRVDRELAKAEDVTNG